MRLRKKRLINPSMQLRLVAIFLCTAALAVQAEAILITYTLTRLAERMPTDGSLLLAELPEFVRTNLLLTFAMLAPMALGVGIVATFRIAGPLYRIEKFLRNMKEGKQIEPCTIRKGDELQELCSLLNDVTAPLRAKSGLASFMGAPDLESVTAPIPSAPYTFHMPESVSKSSPSGSADESADEDKDSAGRSSAG
jgi:hypothetical protein